MADDHPRSPETQSIQPGSDPREQAKRIAAQRHDPADKPDHIGSYKILEVLGEGGMGVVYLAEQTKPIHRRVALKVIKLGMDTKQVIARFEAEREALALMNHPNVAKVFDAGATEQGRPYFAMEHVAGIPITAYCDRQRLTTNERLALFIQVCQAVQHAHQKGIIHRDIKPSNVMVTVQDDKPTPKVIDFGVAKATQGRFSDRTLYTEQGQVVGTPGYMSPEQAEMSGLDVDTRTDVYSLGVLLYELLAGELPFDTEALRRAGLAGIHRVIRDTDPARPSTRITNSDQSTSVAQKRRTEPRALARQLRGDLDWITLKCLEKDRTHRYDTVNALAMELQRYLKDEPVLAGPPSAVYRMRKFVRRNRVPVVASIIVVLSLFAGLAGTGVMYARAARERDKATRVADFMSGILGGAAPAVALGRDTTMLREMLDAAAKRIQSGELSGSPEAEFKLQEILGRTYLDLGDPAAGRFQLQRAYESAVRLRGPQSAQAAGIQHNLGLAAYLDGQFAEAERILIDSINTLKSISPADSADLARALSMRGMVVDRLGRHSEAAHMLSDALEMYRRLLGDQSTEVATTSYRLAVSLTNVGDYARSVRLTRESVAVQKRIYGPDHPEVIVSQLGLARGLTLKGDYSEAIQLLEQETVPTAKRVFGERHPSVGIALEVLADGYQQSGQYAAAIVAWRELLAFRIGISGADNVDVARTQMMLAGLLTSHGDPVEADRLYQEAIPSLRAHLGETHHETLGALGNWGSLLKHIGDHEGAVRVLRETAASMRKAVGDRSINSIIMLNQLGNALLITEQYAEAAQVFAENLRLTKESLGPRHKLAGLCLMGLSLVESARGNWNGAEVYCREGCATIESAVSEDKLHVATCQCNLATVLAVQSEFDEVEQLARTGLENAKVAGKVAEAIGIDCLMALAIVDTSRGRFSEAESTLIPTYETIKGRQNVLPFSRRFHVEQIIRLYEAWDAAEPGKGYSDKAAEYRAVLERAKNAAPNNQSLHAQPAVGTSNGG